MSQENRLKLKISRRNQVKKKYKHGEIQKSGSEKRGYKVRYWNQKTGSWQSTKPSPIVKKIKKVEKKPLTRAEKLKQGMATWNTNKGNKAYGAESPGSKMVKKTDKPEVKKPEVKKPEVKKPEVKKPEVKNKETLKAKPKKMHAIEKRNRKKFGDAHVDKLKAQYAKFKADRKKKKK